ncbi:flagellar protein FlgN [Salirhabdus salicampi]|uniref:flagellar protein FlgN n=1 Tax=Salirhabdus salicampi TaxID=476102 RepID=UPI0020C52252|nr:flagellar protein FlgN [Salirhabdus salicampi]MCP8617596.1 flagellar protein FlgN [Salirhabdus salicampi]
MSLQAVFHIMDELYEAHKQLLALSTEKTERLKDGDIEHLQPLLAKERKQARAIDLLEQKRQQVTTQWFQLIGKADEEQTVSRMLDLINDEADRNLLAEQYEKFILLLADIKNQEQLNRQMIEQSLQFIDLSLNMLQPSLQQVNYQKTPKDRPVQKRSVFDSKA